MHSHHSHSGQYVSHAVDDLETIVAKAAAKGFTQFCLTEHMPRLDTALLYPEEEAKLYTVLDLCQKFDDYKAHARKVQRQYESMDILVGFEAEGVDEIHINWALQNKPQFDLVVGSVHHVHGIPIDFSPELWRKAQLMTDDNSARALFKDYFELQHKTIEVLEPEVVGHMDLIRLFQDNDEVDPTTGKLVRDIDIEKDWPEVWDVIMDNITLAVSKQCLFEMNSAAIRKGWHTPYPQKDIAMAIKQQGGKFCLSDDSHGLSQIGLNYHKVMNYIQELQLENIYYLKRQQQSIGIEPVLVSELASSSFWDQYK